MNNSMHAQHQDFESAIISRYPRLFRQVAPLTLGIAHEILVDLKTDAQWTWQPPLSKKMLLRFLATYQKQPQYILMICYCYLTEKPRIGLNSNAPVLKGEVLEVLSFVERNGLEDQLKTSSLYRFYKGAQSKLEVA